MTKDQQVVLDVFAKLEEAFSGAKEYDEVLMDLELHTAKVRKEYPKLFEALQQGPKKSGSSRTNEGMFSEEDRAILQRLANAKAEHHTAAPAVQGTKPQETPSVPNEPTPEEPPTYKYDEWAAKYAPHSRVNEEWIVEWGKPIPMPDEGGPLTITTDVGRVRFQVTAKDESTSRMRVKMIALLPRNQ